MPGKRSLPPKRVRMDVRGGVYTVVVAFGKDAEAENVSDETGSLRFCLGFVNLNFNGVHSSDHHVLPSIQY
jgi:hypothetical protein